jgi:chromosome segregation ATPase
MSVTRGLYEDCQQALVNRLNDLDAAHQTIADLQAELTSLRTAKDYVSERLIEVKSEYRDAQAVIGQLRAALEDISQFVNNRLKTAETQRLNMFDFGDFGMSAQLATASTIYKDVQAEIDRALAAVDGKPEGGGG